MEKTIKKSIDPYSNIIFNEKLIGQGGFGNVFKIVNKKTGEVYAKKQVFANNKNELDQILNEFEILEKLEFNSPFVIQVIDCFIESIDDDKYILDIIMEYAGGGSLFLEIEEKRKKKKYFKETEILNWFSQLCVGLKEIHDKNIVHRDIKSSNIFLSNSRIIKIGDFGISKILSTIKKYSNTYCGTEEYISPEILNSYNHSYETDIWSLGILLYELCTLKFPFKRYKDNKFIFNYDVTKIPELSNKFSKEFTDEIFPLIKKMLSRNPNHRIKMSEILEIPMIKNRTSYKSNSNQNFFNSKFNSSLDLIKKIHSQPEIINNFTVTNLSDDKNNENDELS